MSDSRSEPQGEGAPTADAADAPLEEEAAAAGSAAAEALAAELGALVGSSTFSADNGTAKVKVDAADWVDAVTKVRDEAGLDFFSWLSAIDWSREVAVGDPVEEPDSLDERYEVLCALSSIADGRLAVLATDVSKDAAALDTLVPVFTGAEWHEREAHEMFGIEFRGHPRLIKLYLPDAFEGHPLRKSFPLLSREVKPWPGKVDVEDMPSTENPEAPPADGGAAAEEGDG